MLYQLKTSGASTPSTPPDSGHAPHLRVRNMSSFRNIDTAAFTKLLAQVCSFGVFVSLKWQEFFLKNVTCAIHRQISWSSKLHMAMYLSLLAVDCIRVNPWSSGYYLTLSGIISKIAKICCPLQCRPLLNGRFVLLQIKCLGSHDARFRNTPIKCTDYMKCNFPRPLSRIMMLIPRLGNAKLTSNSRPKWVVFFSEHGDDRGAEARKSAEQHRVSADTKAQCRE